MTPSNGPEISCAGKARHSPSRARQIAADMRKRHPHGAIQPYHCQHCNAWHVGSQMTKIPDKRKEQRHGS